MIIHVPILQIIKQIIMLEKMKALLNKLDIIILKSIIIVTLIIMFIASASFIEGEQYVHALIGLIMCTVFTVVLLLINDENK